MRRLAINIGWHIQKNITITCKWQTKTKPKVSARSLHVQFTNIKSLKWWDCDVWHTFARITLPIILVCTIMLHNSTWKSLEDGETNLVTLYTHKCMQYTINHIVFEWLIIYSYIVRLYRYWIHRSILQYGDRRYGTILLYFRCHIYWEPRYFWLK